MTITVGSMEMLQGLVAKGYSPSVIRDIMGPGMPAETIRFAVEAAKRPVTSAQEAEAKEREAWAKAFARAETKAIEKARKTAAQRYRTVTVISPSRTMTEIIREVATRHNLLESDLIGDSRIQALITPRHEAMYLCARDTTFSIPAIGRRMGNRDHSTIIHGIRRHHQRTGAPLPRGMKPEGNRA